MLSRGTMPSLRRLLLFICLLSAVQSHDAGYQLGDTSVPTGGEKGHEKHARHGIHVKSLLASQEASIDYSNLEASSRVYLRPNDKQDNIISITPETQAHIVIENYWEIPTSDS